jgi:hypothetical protein
MVCNWQDLSLQFNANGKVQIDTSGYDYVLVQIVTPSGTISFASTNDGGAITGATDGNATSALNFVACQGTNQTNGTAETSTASANSIHKFQVVGRFLQISGGAGSTIAKLLAGYCSISS